jgi:hypothetical protein
MAEAIYSTASRIQYCSIQDVSFFRPYLSDTRYGTSKDFAPITHETKIVDFGIQQSYISEDLVQESGTASVTTTHLVTTEGSNVKVTGVTEIKCVHLGKSTTNSCLVSPDVINTVVVSWVDAHSIGALSSRPTRERQAV